MNDYGEFPICRWPTCGHSHYAHPDGVCTIENCACERFLGKVDWRQAYYEVAFRNMAGYG